MGTEMDHFRILLTTDTAISVTNGVISAKKEKRPPISHVSVNDNETFHCDLLK